MAGARKEEQAGGSPGLMVTCAEAYHWQGSSNIRGHKASGRGWPGSQGHDDGKGEGETGMRTPGLPAALWVLKRSMGRKNLLPIPSKTLVVLGIPRAPSLASLTLLR